MQRSLCGLCVLSLTAHLVSAVPESQNHEHQTGIDDSFPPATAGKAGPDADVEFGGGRSGLRSQRSSRPGRPDDASDDNVLSPTGEARSNQSARGAGVLTVWQVRPGNTHSPRGGDEALPPFCG